MTSLEYYIEQIEQFISALTDDIKSGEGTIVTQTKLAVYQEVLEHLEEIEQEPCEDAISRKAILEEFEDDQYHLEFCKEHHIERSISMEMVRIRLHDLPPVNPQPKTGYWIVQDIHNCHTNFKCSECGYIHSFMHIYGKPTADYTYCPYCGARMVEPQESEEISDRNMKMWEDIFKAERSDKK